MQKTSKRVLAVVLALIMALSVFSISASAASNYRPDYQSETHTVFKHTEQTLAPGVEYYNNYAYSSDGKQMVYYVATADISRDDVVVQTSYLNQYKDKQPGMSKLSEQVAFANQYYTDPENPLYLGDNYNVVAGVNASFYNMQTGQPTGVCYVDGTSFGNTSYPAFFAILDDQKTAIMDDTANVGKYDNIWQAVGGQYWLVRDGVDVTADASGAYLTDRHSRTVVGITDDGKVVLMVLDGRQEPFSCGGTMHELAQIMIEAGCKYAMNIDGGGSTTFGARPEGEDDFRVINRPSDGSERSISSGLIIGSLAAPSDAFARASISVEDEYVTPGTATAFSAVGVSSSGSSADIPAEVTYEATLGSVVDGQFVSDGTTGDAVISAVYNGNVVGTATVHVVVPDAIDITSDSVTIPYGKSSEIPVVLKYGLNEVAYKTSDFTVTVADAVAGTINGLTFTAAAESDIASTTVTVALNGTELSDSATLLFGKGSEVIFDFEDGTKNGFNLGYSGYNYYLPNSRVFVADKDNGKVHSGNYALGLNIDYSNSQESGYQMIGLSQGKVRNNVNYYEGAQKLGAWIYIPDEYVGLWVRWTVSPITAITENAETGEKSYSLGSITSQTMDKTAGGTGVVYSFDESGWHYLTADLSQYKGLAWRDYYYCMQFYISDRDGASYGYYAKNQHNINGDFTIYMDDITVDYSTVVEDRDAPVFQSVLLGDNGPHSNEALVLQNGYDSDGYNQLSFSARVADFSASNATGINGAACKAYIDGNDVGCTYQNGLLIAGDEPAFHEGKHTVKFVAYDNAGNRSSVTRTFTVSNVSRKELVKVVPHDSSLDRILHGSLYWVDVVATETENISKVVTTLNLDSMSKWEIDHMTVADGFTASYKVVDEGDKIVELTIEATGEVNLAGEHALVSIPIRAWELDNANKKNPLNNSTKAWTYAEFKATKEFWPVATEVRVQQGLAYYKGSQRYFTGDDVFVWSESWANYANMTATQEGKDYFNAWDGGHIHDAELTVTKAAQAPTCTEDGWTEELSCATCNSVITWSETIPATGHDFEFSPEKGGIVCKTCGAFDTSYTDLYEYEGKTYYVQFGQLVDGWKEIDGEWYYFDPETKAGVSGTYSYQGIAYDFYDNGKIKTGKWIEHKQGYAYFYGPSCYKNGWKEIDGETYAFDSAGYVFVGSAVVGYSNNAPEHYQFTDRGALVEKLNTTGVVKATNGTFYCVNGVAQKAGVVQDEEGNLYYINSTYKAVTSCSYGIAPAKTNGLIPAGTYEFDENGVITNAPHTDPEDPTEPTEPATNPEARDGLSFDEDGEIRVYENGVPVYAGVVTDGEGNYYYINSSLKAVKNCVYGIGEARTNGLIPAGSYTIDADGKIVIPEPDPTPVTPDDGLSFDADGEIRYYVNGEPTYAGVVTDGENYYYINSSLKAVKNCTYGIGENRTNGLIPAGTYVIDADGKINVPDPDPDPVTPDDGLSFDADGEIRFYVDGVPTYAGVVTDGEGNYYYINSSRKAVKNCTYGIGEARTNGLIPAGTYQFDADGKMILN